MKFTRTLLVGVSCVFALFAASNLDAQEIKATVSVSLEQIQQPNERENLSSLRNEIQAYLNSQSFTGKEYKSEADKIKWKDEPVEVNVNIFVTDGNQSTGRYFARAIITAKRQLFGTQKQTATFQFVDTNWTFLYSRGTTPTFQQFRFDEFASFLDMYMLICIGYDLDSYYELGGTQYFQRASQIIQMGANHTDNSGERSKSAPAYRINLDNPSATTRAGFVNELLDLRAEAFRKLMTSYYVNGLDYLSDKPDEAKGSIDALLTRMADFKDKQPNRSIVMQVFFETKFRELCDLYKGTTLPKVWDKLKYNDPSHTFYYDQAQRGK
jgi:hypothetical protein